MYRSHTLQLQGESRSNCIVHGGIHIQIWIQELQFVEAFIPWYQNFSFSSRYKYSTITNIFSFTTLLFI